MPKFGQRSEEELGYVGTVYRHKSIFSTSGKKKQKHENKVSSTIITCPRKVEDRTGFKRDEGRFRLCFRFVGTTSSTLLKLVSEMMTRYGPYGYCIAINLMLIDNLYAE
jgi:hypothetical protein